MAHGVFITFEGLDGCGKSTQMEKLANALRRAGHEVVTTREPGGTAFGEKIRALLLDSRTRDLSPSAELALMFAARAQHLHEVILPALAESKIVLCDRFTDSSEAYQGGGRELGSATILELERALAGGLRPHLTILMDSDVRSSIARARRRTHRAGRSHKGANRSDETRFEKENQRFFERVRQAYLEIAQREPQRVVVIDARRDIETVHSEILSLIQSRLQL